MPQFSAPTFVYDKRYATVNADHGTLFSTVGGCITAEYVFLEDSLRHIARRTGSTTTTK